MIQERKDARQLQRRTPAPHIIKGRSATHLPSGLADFLALQRRIGNFAVADVLSKPVVTPAGPTAVQRLGHTGASDPVLAAEYDLMVGGSGVFNALNQKVTTDRNIGLVDSTANQAVDYDEQTHTIRVPLLTAGGLAYPVAVIRERLLWEMHNASNAGMLGRIHDHDPQAPGTPEDLRLYPERKAAVALAVEWTEWMMIAEHDLRAARIDIDLGGVAGAPAIDRVFQPSFAVPDAGWFVFSNYLRDQVRLGHTAGYDPAAAGRGWRGWALCSEVESRSPAALLITQAQVRAWTSGRGRAGVEYSGRMKDPSNNPFVRLR